MFYNELISPILQNLEMNENSIENQNFPHHHLLSLSLSFFFSRFIWDDKFAYDGRTKFWTKQDFFDFATKQPKNYKSEDFTRGKLVYSKQPRVID